MMLRDKWETHSLTFSSERFMLLTIAVKSAATRLISVAQMAMNAAGTFEPITLIWLSPSTENLQLKEKNTGRVSGVL